MGERVNGCRGVEVLLRERGESCVVGVLSLEEWRRGEVESERVRE